MKRLLIIMLILVAIGVAFGNDRIARIKIKTDMLFNRADITVKQLGPYNLYYPHPFAFDEDTREIIVGHGAVYSVLIEGESSIDFRPLSIYEQGIYMFTGNYHVIEKYFDRFPGGIDTPVTQ